MTIPHVGDLNLHGLTRLLFCRPDQFKVKVCLLLIKHRIHTEKVYSYMMSS